MSDAPLPTYPTSGDPDWDRAIVLQGAEAEIAMFIERVRAHYRLTFADVVGILGGILVSWAKHEPRKRR